MHILDILSYYNELIFHSQNMHYMNFCNACEVMYYAILHKLNYIIHQFIFMKCDQILPVYNVTGGFDMHPEPTRVFKGIVRGEEASIMQSSHAGLACYCF